jgi:LDH2 family malate/lactate/ureidoglycolate dehydrogenase
VVDFNADSKTVKNTGHFVIALDIAAFTDVEAFKRDVDEIWAQMKGSATLPGFSEIRLPGERLAKTMAENSANGIPIPAELGAQLDNLAASLNVARL